MNDQVFKMKNDKKQASQIPLFMQFSYTRACD